MSEERVHYTVSPDGTKVGASVHGQGPPLVLVHGAFDDGTVHWQPVLPYLTDQFTCYVMSLRGRGHSDHSDDLSIPRQLEDIQALVASIGEPVGLAGFSMGGGFVLGAAAGLDTVAAVAVYEPALVELLGDEDGARFITTVAAVAEHATKGQLEDAIRTFFDLMGTDEEVAELARSGALTAMTRNVGVELELIDQASRYDGPRPGDPQVLGGIGVPLLLLQGGRSNLGSWYHRCTAHIAEHAPEPFERELVDAGHLAPIVEPGSVAEELLEFFQRAWQPA